MDSKTSLFSASGGGDGDAPTELEDEDEDIEVSGMVRSMVGDWGER